MRTERGSSLLPVLLVWAAAEVGVPGPPGVEVDGPPGAKARLVGGAGVLEELGEVTEAVEVEKGPTGVAVVVVVPAPGGGPGEGSPAGSSPGAAAGAAPPRSLNRERSFLSRAWMSSTLPWGSPVASHLRQETQRPQDP